MFDAGIVQELFGRRLRLEATYFRNSFQDLIVFDSSTRLSTWSNIDRSWARGLETSANVRLGRYVQVSANYTRLYTKITRTNSVESIHRRGTGTAAQAEGRGIGMALGESAAVVVPDRRAGCG